MQNMKKSNEVHKSRYHILFFILLVFCIMLFRPVSVYAAQYDLDETIYEMPLNSSYVISEDYEVQRFSYGEKSMGQLSIGGDVKARSTYKGKTAYSISKSATLRYTYDGNYQTDNKDAWNLCSCSEKKVNNEKISKKIKLGAIVIQKSVDGKQWENAVEPINNFFKDSLNDNECLYTISADDVKNGMFYRVMVVYNMTRRISKEKIIGFIPDDEYENVECMEVYEYYVESDKNYITINDLVSRKILENNSSTMNGFYIEKNGSTDTVTVTRDGKTYTDIKNYDYFIKPGKYTVNIKATLGDKYSYIVEVKEGLSFTGLHPVVYESKKNKGFPTNNKVDGNTVFGRSSLTELFIARQSNAKISRSAHDTYDAYGVTGQSVSLFLKIQNPYDFNSDGWQLEYDDWGKRKKETIKGSMIGEIGKGALVIQTSNDGKNWKNVDKGRYADGLYTTDFATNYATNENILVYTPSGTDVLNGVYIRVYFAYQVHNKEEKDYKDYIEEYSFYLCNNELNAVTIHNMSVDEKIENILGDADENTVQLYKNSETMLSGACTTTGFSIDTTMNPTVTFTVKKDGVLVDVPKDNKFTESGKYDIHITSVVGDQKDIVIYVDRNTNDLSMKLYFGNGFLDGKRIFAEGEYPVYEGGNVHFNISEVSEKYLPVSGMITNLTTGKKIAVSKNRNAKSSIISEPGDYEAILTTNPNYADDDSSGDTRVFTFHFKIIENGTAPGPMVNKKSLEEYSHSTMIDSKPVYYGLTYQSASKGYITLAFESKEAALKYAYNYEKGIVEVQDDGSYRYNGAFYVSSKSRYESNWELVDAVNYFAEQAVQKLYFNMGDKFTYLTLSPEVIENTDNLRILELPSSVVVFANGEKELLTDVDCLPIINDKPYAYLNPFDKTVYDGENSFMFVTDKYGGIDSQKVAIKDCNGKEYKIRYFKSVGKQLEEEGCPSGVITIMETTKYGDSVSYQAIYIAPNDNQTVVTINGYSEIDSKEVQLSMNSSLENLTFNSFSIEKIVDKLDPYSLVIVRNGQREFLYTAGESGKEIWSEPGDYIVICVNRMGYGYSVNIHIPESDNATISFEGDGAEDIKDILTKRGNENVVLPKLSRYGYDFVGYLDDESNEVYKDQIPFITYSGEKTLTTIWKAKTVKINLVDESGKTIDTVKAKFGEYFELPNSIESEMEEAKYWERNGIILKENRIIVDSEEEITVSRRINVEDSQSEVDLSEKDNLICFWIVFGIVILSAGIILTFFYWDKLIEIMEGKKMKKIKVSMKRSISVILSFCMMVSLLSACKNASEVKPTSTEIDTTAIAEIITEEIQSQMMETENWETRLESEFSMDWFVYDRIFSEYSLVYDTFPAVLYTNDGTEIHGIGYTDYASYYETDDGKNGYFPAGFIADIEGIIPYEETENGLVIENLDYTDDKYQYVYAYDTSPFTEHCVVNGQYVKYGVNKNGALTFDTQNYKKEICDESLGALYSFDEKKYLYDPDMGNYIDVTGNSLFETIDYVELEKEINRIISDQNINFSEQEIKTSAYMAQEAVISYFLSMQEETFLGYDVDDLVAVAKELEPTECMRITPEGHVIIDVENSPPEGKEAFTKWAVGISCAVAVIGTVALGVFCPAVIPFCGAISNVAIEVFMQVVIDNQNVSDIHWGKVAVAATAGALLAWACPLAASQITSLVTKGAGPLLGKLSGYGVLTLSNGLVSGVTSYANAKFDNNDAGWDTFVIGATIGAGSTIIGSVLAEALPHLTQILARTKSGQWFNRTVGTADAFIQHHQVTIKNQKLENILVPKTVHKAAQQASFEIGCQNKMMGGGYNELENVRNHGSEKHEMPAHSAYKKAMKLDPNLQRGDTNLPAIKMLPEDHRKTASYQYSKEAKEYRNKQIELIENGKMRDAIQMDIDDIRSKFGTKYNDAIDEMLNYYNTNF